VCSWKLWKFLIYHWKISHPLYVTVLIFSTLLRHYRDFLLKTNPLKVRTLSVFSKYDHIAPLLSLTLTRPIQSFLVIVSPYVSCRSSSSPWIGSTRCRPPHTGPAVAPLASVLAPELEPTATPLTSLLTLELGFVSSESRRCGGWVDRLRSVEHSCPAAVWPISPLGMAIRVRVPDPTDLGTETIFYPWVALVPDLNQNRYEASIFSHPQVIWWVPDTLLPL
jgi:hypothetical protein